MTQISAPSNLSNLEGKEFSRFVSRAISQLIDAANSTPPPGSVFLYGGLTIPGGYLKCDAAAVSRALYGNLFSAIGVVWGAGDGRKTFNVPGISPPVANSFYMVKT